MKILIYILTLLVQLNLYVACNNKVPEPTQLTGEQLANDTTQFKNVFDSLKKRGVSSKFIAKYYNNPSVRFEQRYIRINVLGYLTKTDYSFNLTNKSVATCKEWLAANKELLISAEAQYGVQKEIIVAILFVETKLGAITGTNHLPSVLFSTALVNEEHWLAQNLSVLDTLNATDSAKKDLRAKIISRSARKSKWAINELVACSKIEEQSGINFDTLYGSWAAAFGLCQFLPSSFLSSAVDGDKDGVIDLFNKADAVWSVANYLSRSGYGTTDKKKRKALYSYNNSNDYVDCVLALSKQISGE
jgi:membrane-bound lytic murein transglycosylase B